MPGAVDKPLFYTALALVLGGFLILASSSMAVSQKNFDSSTYYLLRQVVLGGIPGVLFFFLFQSIPYRLWKKLSLPFLILSLIALAFIFIPELSYSFGGAKRWLKVGPFSFQPSEMLKLSFITYLASWLAARRQEVTSISYGLLPFSLMLAIVGMFLVMQPDIGTLGVIVASAGMLYFLGGGKVNQIATLSTLGLAILYFLVQLAPYRLARFSAFINPGADPQGAGYQINQALIAIGSGGFWGQGFGKGLQKYSYLPEPMSDSIFAIFAEELGFLGVLMLIFLFGVLFWRGFSIARRAPDAFGKLLGAGLTITIAVQTFINIAAISGLLPLTGIPLPFISYGGTSLVTTLASIGILLNISKHT